jgi:chemotaxis methyl-accepting protein methylase
MDWKWLAKYISFIFQDKDKINVYSLASSDGSEAYTMAISILETLSEKEQKKIFPILASDKNEDIVNIAKSGRINLTHADLISVQANIKSNEDYFTEKSLPIKVPNNDTHCEYFSYRPISKLANKVNFEKADIFEKLKTIQDKNNSVFLCRNFTPYLKLDAVEKLKTLLTSVVRYGSIVALGEFDKFSGIIEMFRSDTSNFREVERFIFRKL